MRKGQLLNSEIVSALSLLGHTDQITVADAGLPIPGHVKRIDLALKKGIPSFIETVSMISSEMVIEKIILAEEIKIHNPLVLEAVLRLFPDCQVVFVDHEHFKALTQNSRVVIRTGECTPYANIIFQSGVDFEGA